MGEKLKWVLNNDMGGLGRTEDRDSAAVQATRFFLCL